MTSTLPGSASVQAASVPTGQGIVQVHPSRRCNLTCLHCYSSSGPTVDATVPQSLLLEFVGDTAEAGYSVLSVSGGEPLLYRGLDDLLRTAKSVGMTTTITTNAMLLTARRLAELDGLADLVAISLDGVPESHNRMRGNDRAFERMAGRLPAVRASGIPFGFIFTLTQQNLHELEWVARYADAEGASLLQVHPLELEGFARTRLGEDVPDSTELLYTAVEAARLSERGAAFFQLDLSTRLDLLQAPARFLAADAAPPGPLGSWLSPLVLETDATVVPISYGFPHEYALGNLSQASLPSLAAEWDPGSLLALGRETWRKLTAEDGPPLFNWYEHLVQGARRKTGARAPLAMV